MQINPYLHFNGDCEEAFHFYAKILHGKIERMMTYEDSPIATETPVERRQKIMHVRMTVGDGVLMGSDAPPEFYNRPQGFQVSVEAASPEEADRMFEAFKKDGDVRMPLQKTFWAERFGMVTDRFGTPWMISCEKPTAS